MEKNDQKTTTELNGVQTESGAEIEGDFALLASKKTFRGLNESCWLILQRVSFLRLDSRLKSFINFGIPHGNFKSILVSDFTS